MNVNCTRVRSHLGDHLEGDLALRFRTRVDEHLGRCASCSRDLSELRSTVGLLRSLPAPQPPGSEVDVLKDKGRLGEVGQNQAPRALLAAQLLLDGQQQEY